MICEKCEALSALIDGYRRERDEAQARVIDAALIHADLVRERDEARAQLAAKMGEGPWSVFAAKVVEERDRLRGVCDLRLHIMEQLEKERDEARASVADAYRRGAEEMRLACQQWCRAWENNGEAIADALADLRVEDKP